MPQLSRAYFHSRVSFREESNAHVMRNSSSDGCPILQLWTYRKAKLCVAKILVKMMGEETAV